MSVEAPMEMPAVAPAQAHTQTVADAAADDALHGQWPADRELDTRGRTCPMPVLLAKRALDTMLPGQVLLVTVSDPNAPADFDRFSRRSGHALVRTAQLDGGCALYLRRA